MKYLALIFVTLNFCQEVESKDLRYSGINSIEFIDESRNKDFVGNGFLIEYKNKQYAVTVKHTLFLIQNESLKTVNLQGHTKQWKIHPMKTPDEYVLLGKLINQDDKEMIDGEILNKDWMVFEIVKNSSPLAVLKLRESPLKTGEKVSAFGCSYINKATCSQDQYSGTFIAYEKNNLRVKMPNLEMKQLSGLSGSPVVDENNKVVGIVSNVLESKEGNGLDFAPASLDYLLSVLSKI
jgi:hypothetical protein